MTVQSNPVITPSNSAPSVAPAAHKWQFFRAGGLDQVRIDTADDLRNLAQLDLKLWAALACPVTGLEMDAATLTLIDSNKDGRIRASELIETVEWICAALHDPASIIPGSDRLSLSNIADPVILNSAQRILTSLGKQGAAEISLADASSKASIFAQTAFNGDGVVTTLSAGDDHDLASVISEIAKTQGSVADRSGTAGVNSASLESFYSDLAAHTAWVATAAAAPDTILPLGDATAAALAALDAVRTKIDDFFGRNRLAAFDTRSIGALNRQESEFMELAAKDLSISVEEIGAFPIARVDGCSKLPLNSGINPAWSKAMRAFCDKVVTPVLGADLDALDENQWQAIKDRLAPYQQWMAAKAGSSVASLGIDRVRSLLDGNHKSKIAALIAADKAVEPEFLAIAQVERLMRLHTHLYTLLINFVSFAEFYSSRHQSIFQAGQLYLDARTCGLVIRVGDAAKHASLAGLSKAFLVYCDCSRPASAEKISIVAAFTNGDSDHLMVGRNGIFYDRAGRDWDATITRIVENPISIRQAFWSPYKKFVRMLEDQVNKRAAAADSEAQSKLASAAEATANTGKNPPAAAGTTPPKKIDVGTVAAIGVAASAAAAVLTGIIGGILGLALWQIPLAMLGVMLAISGPSMLIAGIKLRQRNLGPILDANGWAINGRVKINLPLGNALTHLAKLPPGSHLSLSDPFAEKPTPWRLYILILALLALGAGYVRVDHNVRGHYFWQSPPAAVATDAPAPPVAAPPTAP
jgi:hypothetical protein